MSGNDVPFPTLSRAVPWNRYIPVSYTHLDVYKRQDLFRGQEELLVQFLVQLIEDQAALGGYQCGIRVGIFLVSDVHDGLALFVDIIQHPYKILLIVTIIAVAFCDDQMCIRDRNNDSVPGPE